MAVNIIIDGLTNCIKDRITGEEYNTVFFKVEKKITKTEARKLKSQGWKFDWSIPQTEGYEVYELYIEDDDTVQGMVAFKRVEKDMFVEVSLVESAPHNIGHDGRYEGVGGNLFAIACKDSFDAGFDGYVRFESKTKLVKHYKKELGAKTLGPRNMIIYELEAKTLVEKYIKKSEGMKIMKVKETTMNYSAEMSCGLDAALEDGRLTEPWDPNTPNYDWRKMVAERERLGRPLTQEEMNAFIRNE